MHSCLVFDRCVGCTCVCTQVKYHYHLCVYLIISSLILKCDGGSEHMSDAQS